MRLSANGWAEIEAENRAGMSAPTRRSRARRRWTTPRSGDRLFAKMHGPPETLVSLPEMACSAASTGAINAPRNSGQFLDAAPVVYWQSPGVPAEGQALSQDPNFTAAAGDYVGGMKADLEEEIKEPRAMAEDSTGVDTTLGDDDDELDDLDDDDDLRPLADFFPHSRRARRSRLIAPALGPWKPDRLLGRPPAGRRLVVVGR